MSDGQGTWIAAWRSDEPDVALTLDWLSYAVQTQGVRSDLHVVSGMLAELQSRHIRQQNTSARHPPGSTDGGVVFWCKGIVDP